MIKVFIHNVSDLGLGGVLLWAFLCFLILLGTDYIFCNFEKLINIPRKIYWWDLVSHVSILFLFIFGIYYWDNV